MPVPDDIYKDDVDFTTLSMQYSAFAERLKPNRQLDFSDPESVRQLTKALLHRDFDLRIDLPEDRLCPPVPNRFNYILFIRRLLDSTSPDFGDGHDPNRQVIGLDIGTGASCIYPLLACRQHPKWLFLATEIDERSRTFAQKNIKTNNLQSRIKILDTDLEGKRLIPVEQVENFRRIDVMITNPPFYESQESMLASAKSKSRPANSSCTGAPVEMITPGGEVEFVSRLILESLQPVNRRTIQWFSSMLGKLSSVGVIVERLRAKDCNNYVVGEFVQGQKTRRWVVAWSWMGWRPSAVVARGVSAMSGVERKYLPATTEAEFQIHANGAAERDNFLNSLNDEMSKLALDWSWEAKNKAGVARSSVGDVWSRKARRKRAQDDGTDKADHEMKDNEDEDSSDDEREPPLVVRISVQGQESANNRLTLRLRWLQGPDHVLFESFCGWLKRKLGI